LAPKKIEKSKEVRICNYNRKLWNRSIKIR
jgi:hypothetical protein